MSGESPSFRKCDNRISSGIERITSPNRGISRYFTFQISSISERYSSLMNPIFRSCQIDSVKMMLGQSLPDRIVRWPKRVDQMEKVRQIAPQNFFFVSREAEWLIFTLLSFSRVFARPH